MRVCLYVPHNWCLAVEQGVTCMYFLKALYYFSSSGDKELLQTTHS